MNENQQESSIARDNGNARERGQSVSREFERVVNTFNRVLQFKEKVRLNLENRIRELHALREENQNKLNTLNRNIQIYDQNVAKIVQNLQDFQEEETRIKDQYNKLLQGASMEVVGANVGEEYPAQKVSGQGDITTHNLMQKRNHYLDNLSSSFQKLDGDLYSIENLRAELLQARSEIFRKKDQALEKKNLLEDNRRQLDEESSRVESDLEISVKEEEVLTLEYAGLIGKVENCLEISEHADRVLFSSLTAANDSAEED